LRVLQMGGLAERSDDAPPHRLPVIDAVANQGQRCFAGARYLWVNVDGRVYRCANEMVDRRPGLGRFEPGLTLLAGARSCRSNRDCCVGFDDADAMPG
jgi:hypothetical protein